MNGTWGPGRDEWLGSMVADAWLSPWHRAYGYRRDLVGRIWIAVLPDYGMWYQLCVANGWGDWIAAPPGMCLDDLKQFLETLERLNG